MSGESYSSTDLSKASKPAGSMVVCPHCEAEMPAAAAFCPACGWSMKPIPAGDRALGALAYLTFVPPVVFLLFPGFRTHRFLRFHAWQSLMIWAIFAVLTVIALILSNVAAAIVFLLFGILASLAMLFLWIVLSIKAWQGERFELPWLGEFAARMR
ncbi:MAG TPA: hypothetical protein VMT67_01265 [Terriglobales bacterium]|nr:hypothetical protein [Terriglobales bacterium]